ncbi:hypothetical protein CCACVL1_21935 [Corchorus capsularis]|uniref:Uncharacterized protein n=1 Tax=Corchorus capsularis TaxID=210143 RepID=A0A1R3H1N4_COCAP|nr:hypothetical protein CCACVL1_21935 [Corchorus capsularis]
MLETDALLLKNAQSHTLRKIIVFASLGIRHGCEDMYELDFNHFSILRKGDRYVRQRMGRNKLKSFGPLMCQMAMLVHVRSWSFFFKALGITLLFMAGFPDNFVQRETKYRNLDLLQKYHRTDEDAEGEELFLSHPIDFNTKLTGKTTSTKPKGKKRTNSSSKSQDSPNASVEQSAPSGSRNATQFGLMGLHLNTNSCNGSGSVQKTIADSSRHCTTLKPNGEECW